MNHLYRLLILLTSGSVVLLTHSCTSTNDSSQNLDVEVSTPPTNVSTQSKATPSINGNPTYFVQANLAKAITQTDWTLSNDSKTACYIITIKPTP